MNQNLPSASAFFSGQNVSIAKKLLKATILAFLFIFLVASSVLAQKKENPAPLKNSQEKEREKERSEKEKALKPNSISDLSGPDRESKKEEEEKRIEERKESAKGLKAAGKGVLTNEEERESEENEMDYSPERDQFDFDFLKDPATGKIPPDAASKAANAALRSSKFSLKSRNGIASSPISVIQRGPNNLGGRTRAIGIDVRDPNIMMAGSVSSGVYRSTNGGTSWIRVAPIGQIHNVTAIAQDTRPGFEDTWYYGTGEPIGNSASLGSTYFGNGIWKSTDNGITWNALPSTVSILESFTSMFDFVNRIAVDPTNGNVYAAASNVIMRSTDNGDTWSVVLGTLANSRYTDIIVTPTGQLYAAFDGRDANAGVWTSLTGNAGDWTKIGIPGTTPGWQAANTYGRTVLTYAPSNPDIVYALYWNGKSNACVIEANLFKWDNSITTWTNLSANLPNEGNCLNGNSPFAVQTGYDLVVAVKPDNANTVFVGGTNVYRSTDGFTSNSNTTRIGGYNSPLAYDLYPNHHPDIHTLVFAPGDNDHLITGDDGGIQKGDITVPTVVWTSLNNNYTTYQYYHADINPETGSDAIAGGAQDNGTTANPGGVSFSSIYGGDGCQTQIISYTNATNFNIIASSQSGNIVRLIAPNSSISIRPSTITTNGIFVTYFNLDQDNTNYLYYASGTRFYRTRNARNIFSGSVGDPNVGWENMTGSVVSGNIRVMTSSRNNGYGNAAYSVSDPNRKLYIGTENGRVYRMDDPAFVAASTVPTNITPPGLPASTVVSSISVNPYDDKEILVTVSNYNVVSVYHTFDASIATPVWTSDEGPATGAVTLGSARSSIITKIGNSLTYFVGNSTGLYSTQTLSGATTAWEQISPDDINYAVCASMRLRVTDNVIVLGTHGNGMYELQLPPAGDCPVITITNPAVLEGSTYTAFSQTFTQSGGSGTCTFSTTSQLPPGFTFSSTGELSGSTSQTGTFPIKVVTTDENGCVGVSSFYNLVISGESIIASDPVVFVAENGVPPNNAPDPNETVTVNLPLINPGTANTTNLVATLLSGGGVTNPGSPQVYGVVTAGGTSAAMPYTFMATGNCGELITLTLALQDGAQNLGTVSYSLRLGALGAPGTPQTFFNSTPVSIPSAGTATPYPSEIPVSGLAGLTSNVTLKMKQFNHTYPADVSVLLVSPTGEKIIVMAGTGSGNAVVNADINLDDDAATLIPDQAQIVQGSYKPTSYFSSPFPPGAPSEPYLKPATQGTATLHSAFAGKDPNGTWKLFVLDGYDGDQGNINGGWEISITTAQFECSQVPHIIAGSITGTIVACEGSPSADPSIQQFSVSGANLSTDIAAAAPVDFEISTSVAGGYAASVTIPNTGGTIYVRSSATAPTGTVSGNVALTSVGATPVNVAVSGVVNPKPIVSFSGLAADYCVNAEAVTLNGSPAGGTFSGTGISGNTFDPATSGAGGPFTITYSYTDGNGCSNNSSETVNVNGLPIVSFGGLATDYCVNASAITLTGNPTGGTFSGPGITGDSFDPATAGVGGSYSIIYSYTDGNGCSNSSIQTVNVNDLPAVSFSGLAAGYCVNAAAVTLTGSPAGGTFSGTGISGNTFDPATAGAGGPYTITYSYADGNGCSNSSIQTVSVTETLTWYLDSDGDGYHATTQQSCISPGPAWSLTTLGPDCNDNEYNPTNSYSIITSAGSGGSITASNNVNCGENATVTVTPDPCNHIVSVSVDGVVLDLSGSDLNLPYDVTFNSITANHTVDATFELNSYNITASAGPNGTITPGGVTSVNCGASQLYTITAAGGFIVQDVLVDGISQGAISTFTFTSVTTAHTISATFIPSVVCSATGNITYQVWNNIGSSTKVSSLTSNINYPYNPTSSALITSMEAPINQADNFGSRIAGYICAPATGSYTFWIASNNEGELWLSSDDQPGNKQKIAFHTDFTAFRQWDKFPTQKSAVINLMQGKSYYIEALMKESINNDNLSVGWLKPGQSGTVPSEVVPGSVLSPLQVAPPVILVTSVSLPSVSSVNIGSSILLTATVLPVTASNNTLDWSTSNPAVATVNSNGMVTGISAGIVNITATSTDGSNKSGTCQVTVNDLPVVCSATGFINYQVWNIPGTSTKVSSLTSNANYPDNPSSSTLISSMEAPLNRGDNFGARITGYICAPATGGYTFWVASNNEGELWLSLDDQPANKQKIAYHTDFTGSREWNKYTTQKSVVIYLTQGKRYYIEALMKEYNNNDNLAVGWLKPGQSGTVPSEVIPGSVLSPFIAPPPVILVSSVSLPAISSVNVGSSVSLTATVLPVDATNSVLNWTTGNPAIAIVNSNGLVTGIAAGTVNISATSTDGSNKTATCLVTVNDIPVVCSATGNITYQVWNNIGSSTKVSSLTSNVNYPDNPSSSTQLTSMEAPINQADNYGTRIAGYICAPATGSYTFWIASNNEGELWLSSDDQPANKQKIAFHTDFTSFREWNKFPSQKSVVITLIQGKSYYIEALMKEFNNNDNLSVGWLKPGQSGTVPSEVIPGSVLSPLAVPVKSSEPKAENPVLVETNVKLLVFPNPLMNDVLNIRLENLSSDATLRIYTVSGVQCYEGIIPSSGIIQVDRSIFKSGMYIIKAENEHFVKTTKLIVN